MITGNEPAYPSTDTICPDGTRTTPLNEGISMRQHFAAMALQGILAGYYANNEVTMKTSHVVADALLYADALINALNQPLK